MNECMCILAYTRRNLREITKEVGGKIGTNGQTGKREQGV
jgi:hypothetical protein